jgi:hypothetical protein
MSAPKQFTERQAKGWLEAIADVNAQGVEPSDDPDGFGWILEFAEEIRPGRGHDLNAVWTDGEHYIQIIVDVYGSWSASVAEMDWLHSSGDDSCGCDLCTAARVAEDAEWASSEATAAGQSQYGLDLANAVTGGASA